MQLTGQRKYVKNYKVKIVPTLLSPTLQQVFKAWLYEQDS
jgi:hypothetical protein